jgi:hypothetical protein
MNYDERSPPPTPTERADCPRTRLAENGVGAVEVCRCGNWQVHIGALTLRLAPCAISGLLGLLAEAIAVQSTRSCEPAIEAGARLPGRRGDA